MRWLCVVAAVLSAAGPAKADFFNGGDLLRTCEGDTRNEAVCLGYVQGVYDSVANYLANSEYAVCEPDGTTAADMRDVVVQDLRAHPEDHALAAAQIAMAAIAVAYHCTKSPDAP